MGYSNFKDHSDRKRSQCNGSTAFVGLRRVVALVGLRRRTYSRIIWDRRIRLAREPLTSVPIRPKNLQLIW